MKLWPALIILSAFLGLSSCKENDITIDKPENCLTIMIDEGCTGNFQQLAFSGEDVYFSRIDAGIGEPSMEFGGDRSHPVEDFGVDIIGIIGGTYSINDSQNSGTARLYYHKSIPPNPSVNYSSTNKSSGNPECTHSQVVALVTLLKE